MKLLINKYKFLLLGALLMCFYNGRHTILIASYLGPILLMIFYRKENTIKSLLLSYMFFALSSFYSFNGVTGYDGILNYIILIGFSFVMFIPFIIDFFLNKKFSTLLNTLILPLAGVTTEYLFSLINPFGTWGSIAYSQYGNIPLNQLACITGIYGISFIVFWTYSFINYIIENKFNVKIIKNTACIYLSITLFIYFLGGMRISFSKVHSNPTVKISSISVPHSHLWADIHNAVKNKDADISTLRNKFKDIHNNLFELTKEEAKNGSKIIIWHESNGLVLNSDYDEFIHKGQKLARENNVYLLMTPTPINLNENTDKNQAILIDDKGNICYEYSKHHIVPGDMDVAGVGNIKYADTPYGRIGSAICFDGDFPSYIRQAGQKEIDILLLPSSDWLAIDPIHSQMGSFRGIENGCSIIRQVQKGLSLSSDYLGQTISAMDYFNTEDKIMISHIPVKGTDTIYSHIGDAFSWICICSFFAIISKFIYKK